MNYETFNLLRLVLLGLAIANIVLSALLTKIHLTKGHSRILDFTCGGTFDCSSVLKSHYGYVHILPPQPVPIAAVGLGYYTLLAVWLASVGPLPGSWHQAWLIPALLGIAGVAGSAWFLYVMAFRLHAWCSLCLVTHAINLPLVAGIVILWFHHADVIGAATSPWKTPLVALSLGSAAALTEIYYIQARRIAGMLDVTADKLIHVQIDRFVAAKPARIPLDENDPILCGPPLTTTHVPGPRRRIAVHTAVIFSDFTCSNCAQMHEVICRLSEQLHKRLRIVHKDFPLNRACNPARRDSHAGDDAHACDAAAAAEAARRMGGLAAFQKMSEMLFTQQHLLVKNPYGLFAQQIGLDADEFIKRTEDCMVRQQVHDDAVLGASLGVHATPTVFLDGKLLPSPVILRGPDIQFEETLHHWQKLLSLLERQ